MQALSCFFLKLFSLLHRKSPKDLRMVRGIYLYGSLHAIYLYTQYRCFPLDDLIYFIVSAFTPMLIRQKKRYTF